MEFQWADYCRPLIGARALRAGFDKAVRKAMALAHEPQAKHLPGYIAKG